MQPRQYGPRGLRMIFSQRKWRNVTLSGLADLAMQDAKAAADELERCVRDLKFCGAMINGHTNGKYLDDRSYDPVLGTCGGIERADLSASRRSGCAFAGACGSRTVRPMWGWGVRRSTARARGSSFPSLSKG